MKNFFNINQYSKKSRARLGEIITTHGVIKTPAFVPVATKGTLKSIPSIFIKNIGIQVAFVNTYHLVTHPGADVIAAAGGINKFAKLNIPLMSDSGGFQVFSLARRNEKARSRVFRPPHPHLSRRGVPQAIDSKSESSLSRDMVKKADVRGEEEPLVIKISEDGVKFRSTFDGKLIEFTPEKSMEYQRQIGADINIAFDECTYYPSTFEYAKKAMERTHQWLKRCINKVQSEKCKVQNNNAKLKIENSLKTENCKLKTDQYLYGVIQGGTYEKLRKKSAQFVVEQNTDGVAIGGVSVGETKKEMRDQVKWVADYLPKDRPVHLLGVGQFDDIIDLVKYGIDTFDCVEPTRLARNGKLYQLIKVQYHFFRPPHPEGPRRLAQKRYFHLDYEIDILKSNYKNDLTSVDEECECYVCKNFTKAYLHHLFKQKEILGYTLATYHNLWVMERFFERIRELIFNNKI